MRLDKRTWAALVTVVGLVTTTMGFASVAVANHVFPDSTDNQAFHTEVGRIAGAGCATGFPDGTFRPRDNVNRQQFAAWMNRCGGRVAESNYLQATADTPNTYVDVTSATLTAGAVEGDASAGGFVLITVAGAADTADLSDCPCNVRLTIRESGTNNAISAPDITLAGPAGPSQDRARVPLAFTTVNTIPAGEERTYTARVRYHPTSGSPAVRASLLLTALYVPFDGGGAALGGNGGDA